MPLSRTDIVECPRHKGKIELHSECKYGCHEDYYRIELANKVADEITPLIGMLTEALIELDTRFPTGAETPVELRALRTKLIKLNKVLHGAKEEN